MCVGKVFITLDSDWKEAEDLDDADHLAAAERAMQFKVSSFERGGEGST